MGIDMSLVTEIYLRLAEPVQISSYQSVLQLAAALNLVLSGYSELRTKIQEEIESRTEAADSKIREVLFRRKERLAQNQGNRKYAQKLETAQKYRAKLSSFNINYYAERARWKRIDRIVLSLLLSWAVASLALLILSSSHLSGYLIDNRFMLLASSILFLPIGIAVGRTLWLCGELRFRIRPEAVYVTGQVTKLFNADFRQFNGLQERK